MPEILLSILFGYTIGVEAISPATPDYWIVLLFLFVLAYTQRREAISKAQWKLCQAINQAAGYQIIKKKGGKL